ncbi:hypothetical protein [Paenibacillus polymyxa]|jgi:hypothetical protein|uniref:hypothetical protein n=1 Tax=Paenibacillus polymyxa TaxID=1406 RepID=UPI00083D0381|nr:hypothetical protein [Paenibacillus polymyxa]ODB61402.1 hypothetical protein A7309_15265 [Paenibacillus polymyxa]
MDMQLKIVCWATGFKFGAGTYEVHDQDGGFRGFCSVAKLKEKGLVRRIDHTKKAEAFLNTDEGRAWFRKNRTV